MYGDVVGDGANGAAPAVVARQRQGTVNGVEHWMRRPRGRELVLLAGGGEETLNFAPVARPAARRPTLSLSP